MSTKRRNILFSICIWLICPYTMDMRIPLAHTQWAIIDNDDTTDVLAYTWGASWQGANRQKQYVVGRHTVDRIHVDIRLHRLIMNVGKGDKRVVHHINGDTLDNRKYNLMIMSTSEHNRLPRK
jgi:hypothetical protein